MDLKLAAMDDLPELKAVYKKIIECMDENNIPIWDDIYPCELFNEDIKSNRLYILTENSDIISAFVLSESNAGSENIIWKNKHAKALYLDRLGVNVNYMRRGIGGLTLVKAIALAKEKGAEYLRLFVADINKPAISLYIKSGFLPADGLYEEIIDDGFILRELGFEIKTSL